MQSKKNCDFLILGTGLAGLATALKLADQGQVLILSKNRSADSNTQWAQGGIAAVSLESKNSDTFDDHIQDTLFAGAGLCHPDIVKEVVEQGPARIQDLERWGVKFEGDLHKEAGHQHRRIYHVQDHTGSAIHQRLLEEARRHRNITILEDHFAIDLLINKKVNPQIVGPSKCHGAYVYDRKSDKVVSVLARATILATGGAGKVYLYTSNWSGATGDGIAMAYRAGARIANLEFMQFHPTCLFHPAARNFLISEALRGEGAELINSKGEPFMKKYHEMGSLAPRDIVARSIDAEMKKTGDACVFLDVSSKPRDFLQSHFPVIYDRCQRLGIDIGTEPIPVVPAAHYLCGGILVDRVGRTDIHGLFAVGETACTGLHGANRLASNSLLECAVFAHNTSSHLIDDFDIYPQPHLELKPWVTTSRRDNDEMIVISHMWDEIRRLMWNYVGIVRSNKRLLRAQSRLQVLSREVREYYWDLKVHPDILELRNIALVASLTVECALRRKESRGINFNLDHPTLSQQPAQDTVIAPESTFI